MDLKEALSKLDPADPNCWTTDGQPKLEMVNMWLGDGKVTRGELRQAFPQFTRQNPTFELAAMTAPEPTSEEEDVVKPQAEGEQSVEEREAAIEQELAAARGALDIARQRYQKASDEMDKVILAREARAPKHALGHTIKAYQAAQLAQRQKQVAEQQVLKNLAKSFGGSVDNAKASKG